MNSDQAREILLLYRPGTADRDDPEFAEALALAKHEPGLGRWFEEHCALHEAVRAKFRQLPVPEGLKEQILSERKAHLNLRFQRKAALLATAVATVVLLIGLAVAYLHTGDNKAFAGFRNRMIKTASRNYPKMDLETNDLGQIRQYLAKEGQGDYVLPKGLEKTAGTGCALVTWQGKKLSMVCFNSGRNANPKEPDLFLFIIEQSAVPGAPAANLPPQLAQNNGVATASWTAGSKTYLLAGLGDEAFIRQHL